MALERCTWSVNASSVMNKATVKPIPADVATPTVWRATGVARSIGETGLDHRLRGQQDSERLADHPSDDDRPRDRRPDGGVHEVDAERHAGVGEGEQRHDHVARPRVQHVLEPFDDRHRSAGDVGRQPRVLDGADVGEFFDVDELGSDARDRWCEQSHRDTRRAWG